MGAPNANHHPNPPSYGLACYEQNGRGLVVSVDLDQALRSPADTGAVIARFSEGQLIEQAHLSSALLSRLAREGTGAQLARALISERSQSLQQTLQAKLDVVENAYTHAACRTQWVSENDTPAPGGCPRCKQTLLPHQSTRVAAVLELEDRAPFSADAALVERQPSAPSPASLHFLEGEELTDWNAHQTIERHQQAIHQRA